MKRFRLEKGFEKLILWVRLKMYALRWGEPCSNPDCDEEEGAPGPVRKKASMTDLTTWSSLYESILQGEIKKVFDYFKDDANRFDILRMRDEWGFTLLHWVAGIGSRDLAELLIFRGAEVNAQGYYGHTPLTLALESGDPEVINLLRRYGGEC